MNEKVLVSQISRKVQRPWYLVLPMFNVLFHLQENPSINRLSKKRFPPSVLVVLLLRLLLLLSHLLLLIVPPATP